MKTNLATLSFDVVDGTGYCKTNYTLPFTKKNLTIDDCILALLKEHEKITGKQYREVYRYAIGTKFYKIVYVDCAKMNDDYYNNLRDKPVEHIGYIKMI